jgi:hypothetical protein
MGEHGASSVGGMISPMSRGTFDAGQIKLRAEEPYTGIGEALWGLLLLFNKQTFEALAEARMPDKVGFARAGFGSRAPKARVGNGRVVSGRPCWASRGRFRAGCPGL